VRFRLVPIRRQPNPHRQARRIAGASRRGRIVNLRQPRRKEAFQVHRVANRPRLVSSRKVAIRVKEHRHLRAAATTTMMATARVAIRHPRQRQRQRHHRHRRQAPVRHRRRIRIPDPATITTATARTVDQVRALATEIAVAVINTSRAGMMAMTIISPVETIRQRISRGRIRFRFRTMLLSIRIQAVGVSCRHRFLSGGRRPSTSRCLSV
jgi:hypothetical protein